MTRSLFVTATGTEIGKTLVTCALAHQLRGRNARVLKPVVSGYEPETAAESDPGLILAARGEALTEENIAAIAPWRFRTPVAPDVAARLEGRSVTAAEVAAFCTTAGRGAQILIVEGAGGLMAPIAERETFLDVLAVTRWPSLIVAGSYLGTLSHIFTAVETLKARALPLAGIVISESERDAQSIPELTRSIAAFLPELPVSVVPRLAGPQNWASAPDLTQFLVDKSSSCVARTP
ncbi:dethiobiotin synthase [Zavarzinia compransoris]|uniref:dethiobiotin synthase n=1 Tax=Zavarzinia marina TaxID=2911065 RepID=UPI001F244B23|nr:dethiobiotin synthase [Zavarzinia marina]MCF4165541.1 dethiobiotin synthase [Zavarzinia marina]